MELHLTCLSTTITHMSSTNSVGVTIVRAEGLRAADSNGKSDPYIVYGFLGATGDALRKTKVIEKTLDPVWNERAGWSFSFSEPEWTVFFEVWDKDTIGKDFLGYAEINLKNLIKEKKEDHSIVLNLGGGPKTKEKEAKKVTGKLHIRVNFDAVTLLDESERDEIEKGSSEISSDSVNKLIHFFREVSGGADTITAKEKIVLLAQYPKLFYYVVSLIIHNEESVFSEETIADLVKDTSLADYFLHIVLVMTDSTLESGVSLSSFVAAANAAHVGMYPRSQRAKEKFESWHLRLLDFDKDGLLCFNDILAFQALNAHVIQAKMVRELLKDPKVAAMKAKIKKYEFENVFSEMYKKFKYEEEERGLVLRMVVEINHGGYETKITKEEFMKWYNDPDRKKNFSALIKMRITHVLKEHSRDAQVVLHKALQKYGCN